MASARTVIIAGAGIGGLSAALALARSGFRVVVFEEASELADIGAGIQLSPNATRVLLALGLGEKLKAHVVAPAEVRIRTGTGADLAHIPLGDFAAQRYGAPYWMIHRGDLQSALLDAVRANPDITLTLDAAVEKFTPDADGVTVHAIRGRTSFGADDSATVDTHGIALIGADGLASLLRYELASQSLTRLKGLDEPRYSNRTAWRATVPVTAVPAEFREEVIHLWLGHNTHLVHYPVKGGTAINIVAITNERRTYRNWAANEGTPDEVLVHFPQEVMQEIRTCAPTLKLDTLAPTSSMIPTPSCPSIRPAVTVGTSPFRMWRSVPQIVEVVIRTMASPASWMVGRGMSSQARWPGP